jgi:hypothetical protein
MTKRKKRNAVTLVSLLLALAALIAVYILYGNKKATMEDADNDTQTISLATMDTKLINSLHYAGKDADITLELKDGTWISSTEPDRPINQNYVKNMINLTDNVTAIKVVNENPEDLDEYGLVKPVVLEATQTDGKTFKLFIGDEVSTGDGYYAMVNNDNKVYLVATNYGDGLAYSDSDMSAVEAAPEITAENIQHITIDNREGSDFELLYDPSNKLDYTNSGFNPWVIKQPYEEGYSADSSAVSQILSNYNTYKFVSNVDYKGEDLSKYGLDNPMSTLHVEYVETSTQTLDKAEKDPNTGEEIKEKTISTPKDYKLYIGNKDANGNYYVKKEGSQSIYTMKEASVDKMLHVNAFDLLNKFVCIPNIVSVDKIDITINGQNYTMEIKRSTVKNGDTEETKATYYYNGKEVEEAVFKDVYQAMISAKIDVENKAGVKTEGNAPFMTISYHISGSNATIATASYYPNNDSFYSIDTGHGVRFLADKRRIDDIAKAIMEFKKTDD